ncbi:MAG: hypothetical protein HW421_2731 [Ignavibacteria bacterium]|nr:hypothetical protein [Ignavibacteria bacterium]
MKSKDAESQWKRNLGFLCIAQFVAMVGMSSCVPFLPFFVRELGVTNFKEAQLWSGFVHSGPFFLSIIAVPFWGTMGDKYGRKLMIVRAIFGLSISVALMGLSQNVWHLFWLRILQGAISGYIAATLAYVSANTPQERAGYAIGLLQSAQSAGNILGPFLGGIITDIGGIRQVFFINGILTAIAGVLVVKFVRREKFERGKNVSSSPVRNLKYVLKRPKLRMILLILVLSQVGIVFVTPVLPFFIESLQAPPAYLASITGVMVGIVGVFNILFAPYWGNRAGKTDYKKNLRIASIVSGAVILLHLVAWHYLMLLPLRIGLGIFFAAYAPILYTELNKSAPAENKGGIMGLASSSMLLGSLLGLSFSGIVASGFGMVWCFVISGTLLGATALVLRNSGENKVLITTGK